MNYEPNLFSPTYSSDDEECPLCLYRYLPEHGREVERFERQLEATSGHMGCGTKTCVALVLQRAASDDFPLLRGISMGHINAHFDPVFGDPMCAYNRLKHYDFFSLFDETNVTNPKYVDFVFGAYKHSRTTSLCPYALLAVIVYQIMRNGVGGEFKKKHDFLWMYNCLHDHGLRLGKLR